ncbi:MAG: hypothetical protein DRP78_01555 [Candidatus Omnitrophota bacterium]|nr:MAG: hypothetical protein DRP78_01555 [Candidatus Omnitrophota bacterium]
MLIQNSLKEYLNILAKKTSVPGGGSAAALVSASGAALNSMAAHFSLKNNLSETSEIKSLLKQNEVIRKKLMLLVDKDADAYEQLSYATKLPKDSLERKSLMQKNLKKAAQIPLEISILSCDCLQLCSQLVLKANFNLLSDLGCAAYFLESGFYSAALNASVNLKLIKDQSFCVQRYKLIRKMALKVTALKRKIVQSVESQV